MKNGFFLTILLIATIAAAGTVSAEVIVLRSGERIEGRILSLSGDAFDVSTRHGLLRIQRSEIGYITFAGASAPGGLPGQPYWRSSGLIPKTVRRDLRRVGRETIDRLNSAPKRVRRVGQETAGQGIATLLSDLTSKPYERYYYRYSNEFETAVDHSPVPGAPYRGEVTTIRELFHTKGKSTYAKASKSDKFKEGGKEDARIVYLYRGGRWDYEGHEVFREGAWVPVDLPAAP